MFADNTPKLKQISVAGTHTDNDPALHPQRLADFRRWLSERHPEAKVIVRSNFKPENYGHCKVKVEPAVAPRNEEEKRQVFIERSKIEDAWREQVGWY